MNDEKIEKIETILNRKLNLFEIDELNEFIDVVIVDPEKLHELNDDEFVKYLFNLCYLNYYSGSCISEIYNHDEIIDDELIKRFDLNYINYLYKYCTKNDIFIKNIDEIDDVEFNVVEIYDKKFNEFDEIENINDYIIDNYDDKLLLKEYNELNDEIYLIHDEIEYINEILLINKNSIISTYFKYDEYVDDDDVINKIDEYNFIIDYNIYC